MKDDDDVSAMWREHHAAKQEKRADNRSMSAALLRQRGIQFTEFTDAHLRVADVYDFWPGTGLWIHLPTGKRGRGVRKLMAALGKAPDLAKKE